MFPIRSLICMATLMQATAFSNVARRAMSAAVRMVSTAQTGESGTEQYRLFFKDGSSNISPWHDIVRLHFLFVLNCNMNCFNVLLYFNTLYPTFYFQTAS